MKGPERRFAGDVCFDVVAAPPVPSGMRVNTVRFAPGARAHWHWHAAGRRLYVTQGVARVGTRDGTVVQLTPGRTVWCPPGEWHIAPELAELTEHVLFGDVEARRNELAGTARRRPSPRWWKR